jgi:hypothetical protein
MSGARPPRAFPASLFFAHRSSPRRAPKKEATNRTPRKVAASVPLDTAIPIVFRAEAPAPVANSKGITPRLKAKALAGPARRPAQRFHCRCGLPELRRPGARGRFRHRRALWPKKYYGLQAGVVDAARRYSPADSSGKQAPASRAPVPYLNVLCRAAKPYASDAATPLHLSCQSFSKKLENHEAAVALHVAHDNLCRVHETPRVTPAVHLV